MYLHARILPLLLVPALLWGTSACKRKKVRPPLCDVHTTTCTGSLKDGTSVSFSIEPRPVKSMADLKFEVLLKKNETPVNAATVLVDLKMPAMYMGENKVLLKNVGEGRYTGKGSIVKCPSGDRLWDAGINVTSGAEKSVVHFRFEVDRPEKVPD